MMLSARIDPHQALQALDLWNGDAMVSYRRSGTLCTKVAVAVDDQDAVTTVAPILQQSRTTCRRRPTRRSTRWAMASSSRRAIPAPGPT